MWWKLYLIYPFICQQHLGCFYLLPTVNSTAVNMGICILFESLFSSFWDIYLGVEFLDHIVILFIIFCLFVFLGPHPRHMEVPRLGVELELELPAYTTTTAMSDPSLLCDLHHSSRQRQILNPLSKARDWTCVLMDTGQVPYQWAMMGTPTIYNF